MMKRALTILVPIVALALGQACSSPDPNARVDAVGPSTEHFDDVSQMLVHRCGSIDCHGSIYRNMRLYGYQGTRLAAGDTPDNPSISSQAEVDANYQAVVGLEPEIMTQVVKDGGAGYDRLTLVRKARNTEAHKGGQRIVPGDNADKCLLTWLSSTTDDAACKLAQAD